MNSVETIWFVSNSRFALATNEMNYDLICLLSASTTDNEVNIVVNQYSGL
jgi:hypothetical protein